MVFKVRMPRIDANVQEGTVGPWLARCDESVRVGQPLVEIITDKASFELEAEHDGILRRQVAPEKSVVPIGYVIALIGESLDEPLPAVEPENEAIMSAYRQSLVAGAAMPGPQSDEQAQIAQSEGRVKATPAARRLAAQTGLSLGTLAARVSGVIRREDVEEELRRCEAEAGQ